MYAVDRGADAFAQSVDLFVQPLHGRVVVRHALREPFPLQQQAVILRRGGCQCGVLHPDVARDGLACIRWVAEVAAERVHHVELSLHLHEALLILAAHLHIPLQVRLQVRQSLFPFILFHILFRVAQLPVDDGDTFLDELLRVARLLVLVLDRLVVVYLYQRVDKVPSLFPVGSIQRQVDHRCLARCLRYLQAFSICVNYRVGVLDPHIQQAVVRFNFCPARKADGPQFGHQHRRQLGEERIHLLLGDQSFHVHRPVLRHLHPEADVLAQLVQVALCHVHNHRALRIEVRALDAPLHNVGGVQVQPVNHRAHQRAAFQDVELVLHVAHRPHHGNFLQRARHGRGSPAPLLLQHHAAAHPVYRCGIAQVDERSGKSHQESHDNPFPVFYKQRYNLHHRDQILFLFALHSLRSCTCIHHIIKTIIFGSFIFQHLSGQTHQAASYFRMLISRVATDIRMEVADSHMPVADPISEFCAFTLFGST